MNNKVSGLLVATAVCALFSMNVKADDAAAPAADTAKKAGVQCKEKNACKGKGACAGASNSCKGQNSCKGHVMNSDNADACKAAGGSVVKEKKKKG